MMSLRSQELLKQTPPATLLVLATCISLHLLQSVTNYPALNSLTLCPQLVVYQGEAYRIVTSALYHGSFHHIGMNLLSTTAIGTMLEKRLGTISLLITILWSILLTSIIYIAIAVLCLWLLDREEVMRQHSIGFSGVLFHLSVLECNLGPQQARSVFGFLRVSPKLYPWVLLVALQVILPGVSFTGHLAGILAGQLQYFQCINFVFPFELYCREMDSWSILSPISKLTSYVRTNLSDEISPDPRPTISSSFVAIYQTSTRLLCQLWETLCVIVLGGRAETNSNTRMPLFSSLPLSANHQRQQVSGNANEFAESQAV